MKRLLGITIGLCTAFFFSVLAGAQSINVQVEKKSTAPVQQPQSRYVQYRYIYQNYQPPSQWMTNVVGIKSNVTYTQAAPQGTSAASTSQDLKQFSQQTQQQMSDFSKL